LGPWQVAQAARTSFFGGAAVALDTTSSSEAATGHAAAFITRNDAINGCT
jgi:hypothetical protein